MGTEKQEFTNATDITRWLGDTQPIMSLSPEEVIDAVVSPISNNKAYFLISGSYMQTDMLYYHPDRSGYGSFGGREGSNQVIRCILKVGDKHWNGSAWVKTPSNGRGGIFYINVGEKDAKAWYTWNDFKNDVDYTYNLDREGYSIDRKSVV